MIQEYLLQVLIIIAGAVLLFCTIYALARKTLTENISMFWTAISLFLIVSGLVLLPFDWELYISTGALLIAAACFALLLVGMFYLSRLLSLNIRRTQELAIQVSLLNQEHIMVDRCLTGMSGQAEHAIWRTNTTAEQRKEEAPHEEYSVCN